MLNHSWTSMDVQRQECLPAKGRSASPSRSRPAQRQRHGARPARRSGAKGARPLTALLHDVAVTGCADDGTTFAVLDLRDAAQRSRLTLVTHQGAGEIQFWELLRGTQVSLDPNGDAITVLPLAQQNQAVLQRLLEQLLLRYRSAHQEDRDCAAAAESLIGLLEQLISGR
jgi:hypothetical protein